MRVALLVASFLISPGVLALGCTNTGSMTEEAMKQRMAPLGVATVTISGVDPNAAAAPDPNIHPGKKIYDSSCTACHSLGVAGAPKFGDTAAWAERMKKGIDTLVKHVKEGYNAMPPGGACPQCSLDDYKEAIDYMYHGG